MIHLRSTSDPPPKNAKVDRLRGVVPARSRAEAEQIAAAHGWTTVIFSHRLNRCTGLTPAEVDDILGLDGDGSRPDSNEPEPSRSMVVPRLRKTQGGAYCVRGAYFARVTVAPQKRRAILLPWCSSMEDARERSARLQALVAELRLSGHQDLVEEVVGLGSRPSLSDAVSLVAKATERPLF